MGQLTNPFGYRDKRIIIFVKEISGVLTKIKSQRAYAHKEVVAYRKVTFKFDIDKPTFRIKNSYYYLVDITKGQVQLTFPKEKAPPEMLELVFTRQIAKQILSGIMKKPMANEIMMILLGIGTGFGIGFAIASSL